MNHVKNIINDYLGKENSEQIKNYNLAGGSEAIAYYKLD